MRATRLLRCAPGTQGYAGGKNMFGLGINATGLLLGGLFFGVYFGSGALTRRFVMQKADQPERAQYFRDIKMGDEEGK